MNANDLMRTIKTVAASPPARVKILWSDGTMAELDLGVAIDEPAFAALRDPGLFARVAVGDWGHSLVWPGGAEMGADSLWLETLSASRREGARHFLEWRLRHGLSLTAAGEALGLSRRMVAYYSNGEKAVPRTVLLACRGWEAEGRRRPHRREKPGRGARLVEHLRGRGDVAMSTDAILKLTRGKG